MHKEWDFSMFIIIKREYSIFNLSMTLPKSIFQKHLSYFSHSFSKVQLLQIQITTEKIILNFAVKEVSLFLIILLKYVIISSPGLISPLLIQHCWTTAAQYTWGWPWRLLRSFSWYKMEQVGQLWLLDIWHMWHLCFILATALLPASTMFSWAQE